MLLNLMHHNSTSLSVRSTLTGNTLQTGNQPTHLRRSDVFCQEYEFPGTVHQNIHLSGKTSKTTQSEGEIP